jgi:benzodiazapine receptor
LETEGSQICDNLYTVLADKYHDGKMAADQQSLLKWLNIIAFIMTVIVNSLAGSTTLIGGVNTAYISDSNPTLITPAGYVFSIWGIIYVLLAVFVIYQALPSQEEKEFRRKIGWLFVLSCVFNIVWLFLWQYELLAVSVLVMFLLLVSLILIYLRLDIGKAIVPMRERLAVHLPFSVYLGWITIATIVNVSAALVSSGWDGAGISQETWAIVIVIVASIITILVIVTRRDIAYGLVVIWALVGIAAKQSETQVVVTTAEICAVFALIALVVISILPRIRGKWTKNTNA